MSEQREKHFKHEGYTVQMRDGEKIYCRTETSTGSRIAHKNCYSEDALVRSENVGRTGVSVNCRTASTGASSSGGGCGQ